MSVLAALAIGIVLMMGDSQTYGGLKAAVLDPLSLFNQRSPGLRDAGLQVQTKTKPPKLAVAPPPRQERVLSQVRAPLTVPEPAEPTMIDLPSDLIQPLVEVPGTTLPPFIVTTNEPNAPPPPGVGAIPEPSTWLTMMVGMFAIAGLLRQGKRRRKLPVSSSPAT